MWNDYYALLINSDGEYSTNRTKVGDRFHDSYMAARDMAKKHCPENGWCAWEIQTEGGCCVKSGRVLKDKGGRVRDAMWPHVHEVEYRKLKPMEA